MSNSQAAPIERPKVLLANFTVFQDNVAHFSIITDTLGYFAEVIGRSSLEYGRDKGPYEVIVQLGLGDTESGEKKEGLEFIQKLRKQFPQTPILVISRQEESAVRDEVLKCGADDYLYRTATDEPTQFIYRLNKLIGTTHIAKPPQ
jgi:DNA-binding NarL/FixJ family response regulator